MGPMTPELTPMEWAAHREGRAIRLLAGLTGSAGSGGKVMSRCFWRRAPKGKQPKQSKQSKQSKAVDLSLPRWLR